MADQKSQGTNSKSGGDGEPTFPRFVYRGNAVAAAGRITRVDPLVNLDHVLPVQAASSLPATGGVSENISSCPYLLKITKPEPRELFYVGGAHTRAVGKYDRSLKAWTTLVCAEVRDVHLLGGRIAVQNIVAEVSKIHRPGEDFPEITPSARCAIGGMSLDGLPVEVKLNLKPFISAPTRAALHSRVKADKDLHRAIGWVKPKPASKGINGCHIVANVTFPKGKPEGVEYDSGQPNQIRWKNIGTIFLGELLVSDISRRLTMLRVMLGCPIQGDFSSGEVETNGHLFP